MLTPSLGMRLQISLVPRPIARSLGTRLATDMLLFALQAEEGLRSKVSLLDQHGELKKKAEGMLPQLFRTHAFHPPPPPPPPPHTHTAYKVSELDKQRQEEEKILHNIQETRALMSVGELAKGVVYTESLRTGWVSLRLTCMSSYHLLWRDVSVT